MNPTPHVLLIDDQPQALQALDFRLKRAGYRTTTAPSGELGLLVAKDDPPSAVILDISMPELNGFQTCRQLKQLNKELPVMILSGKSDPADRFWALECGADDFLTKPSDPALILQHLAALIRR